MNRLQNKKGKNFLDKVKGEVIANVLKYMLLFLFMAYVFLIVGFCPPDPTVLGLMTTLSYPFSCQIGTPEK